MVVVASTLLGEARLIDLKLRVGLVLYHHLWAYTYTESYHATYELPD